ncbi:NAD(P)-dependent alcohol dehydrogenase [Leifsonia sp. EB34]|uniref:NAD(P)-dependent alcohol dehydrogenase n=1 Tax=Leifsonia sp. EB34 TaxID=3156303 RepID=UPI00351868FB
MNRPQTMLGAQYFRYGPPEVLQVNEVPVPEPRPKELLLRVIACSVNRADAIARSGGTRLTNGPRFPKGTGVDVVGEVVARGGDCSRHEVGDVVWGYVGMATMGTTGTAAQYATIDEGSVSRAPRVDDLPAAAALPLVGMTALQALRNRLTVRTDERVLVVGASGGVGSSAVQIAQLLGAEVSSVSGSDNRELCRALGVAQAYSYEALPDPRAVTAFDAIFDCTGVDIGRYRRYLAPGGRMATIAPGGLPTVLGSSLSRRRVSFLPVKVVPDDLAWIASAVESGGLRPVIDRRYPLADIARAHEYVATAHTRGKSVVIP